MPSKLQASHRPGKQCYFLVRDRNGLIYNNGTFETYTTANYALYDIAAVEQGSASAYYTATFPTDIVAGTYDCLMKEQLGAGPVEADPVVATGDVEWSGSVILPLSDLSTSGQLSVIMPIRIARGQAISGFNLYLKSAADHITPFTSGIVSGQISRNGNAFGALQSGNVSEVGLGVYKVNLTSGDLNAGIVTMIFTARGISGGSSDPLPYTFIMQNISGGG